jgi:hypothetical protein
MNDTAAETGAQTQEAAAETVTVKKGKPKATGDLIIDVATEIENLTKVKALNLVESLIASKGEEDLRLGGALLKIEENSWHDGYETFEAFVAERYGFADRKTRYLISIYKTLTTNQIPWDLVKDLGWTKLKELIKVLTKENAAEWATKAAALTVVELQKVLKDEAAKGDVSHKTSADVEIMKFKLKADQVETVKSALAKAKAEAETEYESVALEMICLGYAGNATSIPAKQPLVDVVKAAGWPAVMAAIGAMFPDLDLSFDNTAQEAEYVAFMEKAKAA